MDKSLVKNSWSHSHLVQFEYTISGEKLYTSDYSTYFCMQQIKCYLWYSKHGTVEKSAFRIFNETPTIYLKKKRKFTFHVPGGGAESFNRKMNRIETKTKKIINDSGL